MPLGADPVFLGQDLLDLGHGESDLMLPFQEIGDLLTAAFVLMDLQFPNQPFDCRRDLASPSGALLGLPMTFEKAREPDRRNPVEPKPNRLPVSSQVRRNLRVTQALRGKLSGQHDLSRGLHVQGDYGLSDIYGNIADLNGPGGSLLLHNPRVHGSVPGFLV